MYKGDEVKTIFYTDKGTFCYIKITFRLRNIGETYQRLAYKVVEPQNGRNIEVYMDYMVIKSTYDNHFLQDIAESFDSLRVENMILNPKKCTFGTKEGRFLGHFTTKEGIKQIPKT